MERRRFLLLATAGAGLATGCDDASSHEALYVEGLRQMMTGVRSNFEMLKSTINDFDSKNWRDVVADLKNNMADLDTAITDVENALEPVPPEYP